MKFTLLALALAAAAPPGGAAEGKAVQPQALQLKPKAAMVGSAVTHKYAPFISPSSEPELVLQPRHEHPEASRSSCSEERSLCYDAPSGRIVYKPARALMPDIPGLQRENISVRRDRIVFRYSFK
jgi:hypothetical protein